MVICSRCHLRKHKKHEVVEIEEQKKEELDRNIETIKTNLEVKIRKVVAAKEEIKQKTGTAVVKLMNKKQEMIKKFDNMIKDIEDESRDVYTTIDEDVSTMRESLILLQSLEENVHGDDDETYEEIMNKLETADGIEDTVHEHFSGFRTCKNTTSTRRAKPWRKHCMEM